MDLQVAFYARVSSEQQSQAQTIASQVDALRQAIAGERLGVSPGLEFIDDGYSGATLIRPELERLRDLAAAGGIDRLYVHSPDRLARKYAYQVLLLEELQHAGVKVVFLNRQLSRDPEEELLLQVQGMLAEYERAKILERCRRGKRHAARQGSVNVLPGAPYGYRYVTKAERAGCGAYEVLPDEAEVVRQIFRWIGEERLSIGEVTRRLNQAGTATRTGRSRWERGTIWTMLQNPAYAGQAAFGKTQLVDREPMRRPARGSPGVPRRPKTTQQAPPSEWISIPVPALVPSELFQSVQEQLAENRRRARQRHRGAAYLLQGLLVCRQCGYALYGKPVSAKGAKGGVRRYAYYRCIGTDAYRFGGERICQNRQVRTDALDEVIWNDVAQLLLEPERLEAEYHRRFEPDPTNSWEQERERLLARARKLERGIQRLLDGYAEALFEKEEIQPKLERLRQQLRAVREEEARIAASETAEAELRLVFGRLETLAEQIRDRLEDADWATRREILRVLVKRIEVDTEHLNVVYRIQPRPFEPGPSGGVLQHRRRRSLAASG